MKVKSETLVCSFLVLILTQSLIEMDFGLKNVFLKNMWELTPYCGLFSSNGQREPNPTFDDIGEKIFKDSGHMPVIDENGVIDEWKYEGFRHI